MHTPLRFIPQVIKKSRPIHLTLFLTKRCNADCPFCFYKTTEGGDELTLKEIRRISESLGSLLWLAFSGGEIFLRDDLPKISRTFYKNNSPSIMLFPTNGQTPENIHAQMEEILRDCPESIVTVKVSIDGVREEHDRLRDSKGSYDRAISSIEMLAELLPRYKNFELGVNTVFMRDNQDMMDGIIDHVSTIKGVRTHTISLVRGIDNESLTDVDMDKYHSAIERLATGLREGEQPTYHFKGGKLKAAQDILQRDMIYKTVKTSQRQTKCYAGRLNLVVTETGVVYPCERFEHEFMLGELREAWAKGEGIEEILESEHAQKIVSEISDTCFCTHECYLMTNILFNPCQYPALFKEYLKIR
jgi:radical SAM protein with 4Fe4S-binding SPASM domain